MTETWESECPCGFVAEGPSSEGLAQIVAAHTCPQQPFSPRRWWESVDWDLAVLVGLPVIAVVLLGLFGAKS